MVAHISSHDMIIATTHSPGRKQTMKKHLVTPMLALGVCAVETLPGQREMDKGV
jgi:hypothetical protein